MKERRLFTFCLLLFVAGFLLVRFGGKYFLEELKPPPAESFFEADDRICLKGQVWKKEEKPDYQVLYLKDNSITKDARTVKEAGVILYDPNKTDIQTGNIICVEGKIFFFDEARNPGNFDQKFYYQKQNIHAGVWAEKTEISDNSSWKIRNALDLLRKKWKQALLKAAGEKDGGILAAMILGERQDMDREVKELYQVNGIAHILSISGLHLSFIGIGTYQFLRRRTGSFLAGGAAGIAFLLLYIIMIGFGVAVIRSLVMFLIRVGADMTGRVYDMLTALAVAAVAVIFWQPLAYYDGGFQMSFGAILGIWILGELTKPEPGKQYTKPKMHQKLKQALQSSMGVQMILFPVTLYHYFEFPVYSIALNILIIPLMSALLFLGIAGSLLYMAVEPAGKILIWICGRILDIYEVSCRTALALPGSRLVTGRPDMEAIWFYYIALVITVCLWVYVKKEKMWRKISLLETYRTLVPVLAGVAVLVFAQKADERGNLEVTMLDVGQGDCIFLRADNGKTILVDGGSSDTDQVGRYRIETFLKAKGVAKLDYVFVTHGDEDHMNGIRELMERKDIGVMAGCLVLPVQEMWDEELAAMAQEAELQGVSTAVMGRGASLFCGGLEIQCVQPAENDSISPGNAASLVLQVSYGDFDMLLTGDVEGEGEELLAERTDGAFDVLKAAHHGSKNSTSAGFLHKTQPDTVLISAGRGNLYGHPHRETLERLEEEGCRVYQTAESGAVTISTDGNVMKIRKFLT